jgi:hypothetical protein
MAQEQRDMDTGNLGRSGKDNQQGSGMGSHPGMGRTDSGMSGMQRGSEGLGGQSQGTSSDMGSQQGGLGSDRMDEDDDLQIEGGDAGRGSSSGSGRTQGGNVGEDI